MNEQSRKASTVIYFELLNFVQDENAIPNRYALWKVMLEKKHKISRGAFDYQINKLIADGHITIHKTAHALIPRDVLISISIPREERDEAISDYMRRGIISERGYCRDAPTVQSLYRSQFGRCYWCNSELFGVYHVDHKIPLIEGGSNDECNLCLSCPKCNLRKGKKLPQEFMEETP